MGGVFLLVVGMSQCDNRYENCIYKYAYHSVTAILLDPMKKRDAMLCVSFLWWYRRESNQ